jgi:indole-3-glycerol phosphate synthase
VTTEPDLLSRLVLESRQDLQRRRALLSQDQFERAAAAHTPRDFIGALGKPGLSVIAEMKQRTPTMGVLAEDYRPADLARQYTEGGAVAISVLTQMASFGGRTEHVTAVRDATTLPILRKDFLTDSYEVAEARASGADAVLLIAAALAHSQLAELVRMTRSRGITALVEVHDEAEVATALEVGAQVIGVNHRDLRTFQVDLSLTERLRKVIPTDVIMVAESGIHTPEDARRMHEAGADAILIGEVLMRARDPAERIRELTAWSR